MKNILITGASTGIGFACAEAAAKLRYKVYAGYRKESDGQKLSSLHDNIIPVRLNVSNSEDVNLLYEQILNDDGKLNCLFNNAGVAYTGTNEFFPMDQFRKQMEVNVMAPIEITQKFLGLVRKSGDGRILFTSSAAGLFAKPMMGAYCASKFALEGWVDSLRRELGQWSISVSLFEPGKVKTEIYKKSLELAIKARAKLSEEEKDLYMPFHDLALSNIKKADSVSSDVSEVVDVFVHALTNYRPKRRYPVGGDAKSQAFIAKYLPDWIQDIIINYKMKKAGLKL